MNKQELCELFRYDDATGRLFWRRSGKGRNFGVPAGAINSLGYAQIVISGRIYLAHRLVWLMHYGSWPAGMIDHINGDRADNRLSNLRDVTPSQNRQNLRKAQANNRAGLLGAYVGGKRYRHPWKSTISVDGRETYLGHFATKEEAHAAYVAAKRKLHSHSAI